MTITLRQNGAWGAVLKNNLTPFVGRIGNSSAFNPNTAHSVLLTPHDVHLPWYCPLNKWFVHSFESKLWNIYLFEIVVIGTLITNRLTIRLQKWIAEQIKNSSMTTVDGMRLDYIGNYVIIRFRIGGLNVIIYWYYRTSVLISAAIWIKSNVTNKINRTNS